MAPFTTKSSNRLASAGRGFVYDVLGDDDDYVVPYRWDCAVVDDDEVYSEDSCCFYRRSNVNTASPSGQPV